MAATTNPGEDFITALYLFFRSQGFTKYGAAYMVGSLITESHLDPTIFEQDGPGFGYAQWTDADRAAALLANLRKQKNPDPKKIKELEQAAKSTVKAALIQYAKDHNRAITDPVLQLHFAVQWRPDVTKQFKNANDEASAKQAVMDYENFGVQGTRFDVAAKIYTNVSDPKKTDKEQEKSAGKGLGGEVAPGVLKDVYGIIKDLQSKFDSKVPGKAVSACPLPSSPSGGGAAEPGSAVLA